MFQRIRVQVPVRAALAAATVMALAAGCSHDGGDAVALQAALRGPSRSSSIAITSDDRRVVVARSGLNRIAIVAVRDETGADVSTLVADVKVGIEPRSVAISPDDRVAYVANTVSGTVSVVPLEGPDAFTEVQEIPVGSEPQAIAVTPNGSRLFVANHTSGTVSVIDTRTLSVIDTVDVGGNPAAIAITNDGDTDDGDETVLVTRFFAEVIPGGPGEGFDAGKRGVVVTFPSALTAPPTARFLSPLENAGFSADRSQLCRRFNPLAVSDLFCPDPTAADPADPAIAKAPQGAFPNQLGSILIRNNVALVPSIGASPEPPVRFNVNVQALVHVIDLGTLTERPDLTQNLNVQVLAETAPADPTTDPAHLFLNDVVDIDANRAGTDFLVLSRGGNVVVRATRGVDGKLDIGAAAGVVRFVTGNIPTGLVMSGDGRRAYVNNDVSDSVTSIDLENNVVLERDIATGTPPEPGSLAHRQLVGRLVFFTALGTPDNGLFQTPVRDIEPLRFRGKASNNGWSSCASCHPGGLSDRVTWYFQTGPRQTIPLDGFFSKSDPTDQRIANWSAVQGSITDFNNNARGVQGGTGFAGDPPNQDIFNHGITEGASEALDAMTEWVRTIRSPIVPQPADDAAAARGRVIFSNSCTSCHGGAKWTKSRVIYQNNPTFETDPNTGAAPLDPGLVNVGAQIVSFTEGRKTTVFLDDVGTFFAGDPREVRGQGLVGQLALGGIGFNSPSLLGVAYHAPYFHNGAAQTLADVFAMHEFDNGAGTIATSLTPDQLADLETFVRSIDDSTPPID
jgi:YVTN family beta-propeller protein